MDELKLQESEALDILEAMLDVCDLDNPGPMFAGQHVRGGICKIMDDDAAKLRQYIAARRAAPENNPITVLRCQDCINSEPFNGQLICSRYGGIWGRNDGCTQGSQNRQEMRVNDACL